MNNSSIGCYYLITDNATNKAVEILVGKFCIRTPNKTTDTVEIDNTFNYVNILSPSRVSIPIPSIPARVYIQNERWHYFFDNTTQPLQFTILENRAKKPLKLRNSSNQVMEIVSVGRTEKYEAVMPHTSVVSYNFLDIAVSKGPNCRVRLYITNPCHDTDCKFSYPTIYHHENIVVMCIDNKDETLVIVKTRSDSTLSEMGE